MVILFDEDLDRRDSGRFNEEVQDPMCEEVEMAVEELVVHNDVVVSSEDGFFQCEGVFHIIL